MRPAVGLAGPWLSRLTPRGRLGRLERASLASGLTVRHLTLDQGIEGSNPSSPANPQLVVAAVDLEVWADDAASTADHHRPPHTRWAQSTLAPCIWDVVVRSPERYRLEASS